MKMNMLSFSLSDIEDSLIGKSLIKLKMMFEAAKENGPCVLFIGILYGFLIAIQLLKEGELFIS